MQDEDADVEEAAKKDTGREYVTKVEANYCSLCREYLSRRSDDEKAILDHCKLTRHQKWYQQSKKDNEKKSKLAAKLSENKQAKSPDKHSAVVKQNGSVEKEQKVEAKTDKDEGENSNEEKEDKSKFKR